MEKGPNSVSEIERQGSRDRQGDRETGREGKEKNTAKCMNVASLSHLFGRVKLHTGCSSIRERHGGRCIALHQTNISITSINAFWLKL